MAKHEIENLLPNKYKEVFLMSKQEGLTYIEISEHLNIFIKTVEFQMLLTFKKQEKGWVIKWNRSYSFYLFLSCYSTISILVLLLILST